MTTPENATPAAGKTALGGRVYELVEVAMREAGDKPRAIVRLRQLAGEWFQQGNADDAHALVENLIRWGENNNAPSETINALKGDLSAIKANKESAARADGASARRAEAKPQQPRKQKNDDGQKNHASPARFNVGGLFFPAMSAVVGFMLALVLSGVIFDSPVQESPVITEAPVQHSPAENTAADSPPVIDNPPLPEQPAAKPERVEEKRKMYVSAQGGVNIRADTISTSGIVGKAERFADVVAIGKARDGWQKVQVGDMAGYIRGDLLADGDGKTARCESDVRRPANGEVFVQHAQGRHLIEVSAADNDTFAKLKNENGRTMLSFYIHANQKVIVDNVADGSYFFQFSTGSRFSIICRKFMNDALYSADRERNDMYESGRHVKHLEYGLEKSRLGTLKPHPISEEEFLR